MVPFQKMQETDAQRALELVVLVMAHVIDLLGNVERIGFRNPTRAQQCSLLTRPAVEVAIVTSGLASGPSVLLPCRGTVLHDRNLRRFSPQLPNISLLMINRITS